MAYLPDWRPGMIVSKLAVTKCHLTPMTFPSAWPSSGSHPTIVFPSEPTDSFGGYVGSVATVSVPLDLILAGTSAAILLSTPVLVVVAVVVLEAFFPPPPQPVATTAMSAPSIRTPASVFVWGRIVSLSSERTGQSASHDRLESYSAGAYDSPRYVLRTCSLSR